MGFSPALGFIHTGKMLSFVYDVADLYKADLVIPAAFQTVAEGVPKVEARMRRVLRMRFRDTRLLERVAGDLLRLFEGLGGEMRRAHEEELFAQDATLPGRLWDPEGEVLGGLNYGGDDSGEGSAAASG